MDQHSRNEALQKVYQKFKEEWTEENYPALFKAMKKMRRDHPEKYPHELGHFAIFYTPIPDGEIKYMVIGNNPSWFDKDAKKKPKKG